MKAPSPAQLAARKRFAEMARSGAFKKATKRKTNPLPPVVETILEQMGGNKFMVMTGARPFVHGPHMLTFKLPTNQSKANYLDVIHNPGKDLYTMTFRRVSNRGMDSKNLVEYDDVYADQLQPMFEKVTGMYTTLGTMGRKANPEPTHDFAKIGKPFSWDGRTWKVSQYAHTGKTIEAFTTDRKSPYRRETLDVAMLMGPRRKTNPMHKYTVLHRGTANVAGQVTASGPQAAKQKVAEKLGIPTLSYLVAKKTNPAKKTVSQKISQLRHEGYPQHQAVAVALSEQRAGKVKRNPSSLYAMKTQYLVSCPATKKNMGFFDKQSDAKIYAQELADKHGMQYAISTVKVPKIQAVHFVVGESTKSFKV